MKYTFSNFLTTLRLILGPFIMYFIITSQNNIIALSLFIAAILTDFFDGMIARKRKEITKFGEILDSIADKLLLFLVLLGLLIKNKMTSWIFVLFAFYLVYLIGFILFVKKGMKKDMVGKNLGGICFALLIIAMIGFINDYVVASFFLFSLMQIFNYLIKMLKILRGKK